ncbi:uncharacterized protein KRP23_15116 [Phytophthora ramorum]|uniref:uncharacterized protein n=1 Tax=Phytophthora ramorum TaxID=164328 RepID=UPI0030B35BDC|nr:hypothetical protein KRP23_15116 [Phytophthora ramorum]
MSGRPRGILKKTQSPVTSSSWDSKSSRESPDQWFQRIMHVKKLSPLDLCEVFSYGDARKHPLVPLSHVCEVLFDLDPDSANGADPVTDEMEDVLYQFATDRGGKASTSSSKLQIVNLHEQELVEIASKLQFSGVKHLEELLKEGDAESTGFVRLKQLSYLLADQFQLDISEVRLIEVCMGMNFNSSAQLDYQEFVDVLSDILIYALPDIRESAKRTSLVSLDTYLQSGFPPGRKGTRQLLDALCSKYDVNGDQCISVGELIRVFHKDLEKRHALGLPFPLEEHETIQLAHPFLQRNEKDKTTEGVLSYPELLDAIFGPFPQDFNPGMNGAKPFKRALRWEFWRSIYMNLCAGDTRTEEKVLTQLTKILTKVDPKLTYTLSTRHFQRIFERHISSEDLEVIMKVLAVPEDATESDGNPTCPLLRYDVLLKLIFGSPELNDEHFFDSYVRRNLLQEQERLQSYASELVATTGAAHRLSIRDFYDTFVVQAEAYPLSVCALLFLFSSVSSSHDGTVDAKALKDYLSRRCWRTQTHHERSKASAGDTEDVDSSSSPTDFASIKKLLTKCCDAYDLQRVVDDHSNKTKGWISQTNLLKELTKMLRELGVAGVQQDMLKQFVQSITNSNESATKQTAKPPTRDALPCGTFFDALFDWDTLIQGLRLPHSLVEIKKVFETLDLDGMGSIRCEDWNKAYRLICRDHQSMAGWKIRVLHRRFPDNSRERGRDSSIDFARLLVYLLAYQQGQERKSLQDRVLEHFQLKFTTSMSTAEMERLFRALDTDNKGHFNAADLKAYLTKEFLRNTKSDGAENRDTELLKSSDALAAVMHLLAGDNGDSLHQKTTSSSSGSPTVVTRERFLAIGNSFSTTKATLSPRSKSTNMPTGSTARSAPASKRAHDASPTDGDCSTISSLRVLEITILEIASEFANLKGNILPTRAFQYLSHGPSATDNTKTYRPSSPLRRSTSSSPTNRGTGLSVTTRNQQRILEASTLDPLTPTKLKELLQVHHKVDVSTHLISQFFLHIGSPSKHFLDLAPFSQWVAPLSVELQAKVRGVVRQMIVKGKGGGGKLDLDRFLAQLQRRLQDSPQYMASSENSPLQLVSMSLLLSKLHQLNIPLHKQELVALLRHFGMEGDLEAVDYALLLQRLYELNSSPSIVKDA